MAKAAPSPTWTSSKCVAEEAAASASAGGRGRVAERAASPRGRVSPLASARRISDGQLIRKAASARAASSGSSAGERRARPDPGVDRVAFGGGGGAGGGGVGARLQRRARRRRGDEAARAAGSARDAGRKRERKPAGEARRRHAANRELRSGGFVGLDEQPVRIVAAERRGGRSRRRGSATASVSEPATTSPSLSRVTAAMSASKRTVDLGDPAVEPRILDHRALDRDQAVVEHVAGRLALGDRRLEGCAHLVAGEMAKLLAVALPEGFEDHPVGGLGAFEEAGDVEARIGGDDRADAGGGAVLIDEAARLGGVRRRRRRRPAPRLSVAGAASGRVTGCCSWPVRWPSTA